jgi:anthranilate synthase component 2
VRVLCVDNYDSFTWNLVALLDRLGATVEVAPHDAGTAEELAARPCDAIVLSPGPCTPAESHASLGLAGLAVAGRLAVPVLGVCLGHQAIGQAFGGRIVHAATLMHGKTSAIQHDGRGVFRGLPDGYMATRYHSLVIERASLPDCLEVSAWTADGEIMGVRHKSVAVEGVQFHPESILTEHGHRLLKNFLEGGAP